MTAFQEFVKAAPAALCLDPGAPRSYKFFLAGKGCTLGVLFEDTLNVYFEWLTENGLSVSYAPEIRFRSWPKRDFARLLREGVWDATCSAEVA